MNIKLHKMAINYSQTLSEMIQSQIDDIVQKYHCYLSFRDCLCFLIETHQTIYYLLSPYNKQPSPLCSYIRANTNHSHCILSKEKLANKFQNRTKPIYGACYLGLEQFHFPIILCGKIVGMIFIGMYCTNKERSLKRLKQACDNYQIDYLTAENLFEQSIKSIDFDICAMENDVQKLCNSIALLYANELQNSPESDNFFFSKCTDKQSILKYATTYIKDNYNGDLSLEKIAKFCHCNPNYLSNLFVKKYNMTIIDYILSIRLKKAKEYLSMTTMSIKEIAIQIGFNYPNYFSKVFKEKCGETPLQYRKKVKTG